MLRQRFWLDLCTKQVVSATQTGRCFISEQIDTLVISVGGRSGRGVWGVGGHFGGPKFTSDCQSGQAFLLKLLPQSRQVYLSIQDP